MNEDPYNLNRFLTAQEPVYETVLNELRAGKKSSHWIWYIFPQIEGLGTTPTSKFYSIKSKAEARAYLDHPILGKRLTECAEILLGIEGKSAHEIFDSPDDLKLRSSMTLFAIISEKDSIFHRVLNKYFQGMQDNLTLTLLSGNSISTNRNKDGNENE